MASGGNTQIHTRNSKDFKPSGRWEFEGIVATDSETNTSGTRSAWVVRAQSDTKTPKAANKTLRLTAPPLRSKAAHHPFHISGVPNST